MIFLSQFALELQRLMVLNFQFPTKYGVFPCLWREQDRWTLNSNDYVLGPSSRNMAVKMKRMVQWFVHWILVCPKNPFILEEVKTQKTFEFPWSTTRVCPKERADKVKIDPLSDQKTTHLHRPFHTCEFFSLKNLPKNFHEWPHLNFWVHSLWESSQKCEVGEVVYLTQMENVVLLWVLFFWGGGERKQWHNIESVEIPFVVWGQNKLGCKSRIVTHTWWMFFRVYWKFPLPRAFKLFAPFFGNWNESCFSLEDLKFFIFRDMKPAFRRKKNNQFFQLLGCDQAAGKFREMVEILIIGQISSRPNRPVVTPNGFSKGKCPSFKLKN